MAEGILEEIHQAIEGQKQKQTQLDLLGHFFFIQG